jgi:hypothetical protein
MDPAESFLGKERKARFRSRLPSERTTFAAVVAPFATSVLPVEAGGAAYRQRRSLRPPPPTASCVPMHCGGGGGGGSGQCRPKGDAVVHAVVTNGFTKHKMTRHKLGFIISNCTRCCGSCCGSELFTLERFKSIACAVVIRNHDGPIRSPYY